MYFLAEVASDPFLLQFPDEDEDEEESNSMFPEMYSSTQQQQRQQQLKQDDSDDFSDLVSVSQVGTLFSASGIHDPEYVPSLTKSSHISNISDYFSEEDNSDGFIFNCEFHNLTFENLDDFEEHQISQHSINGRIACGICEKTYSTKYLRRNHIKGYHLGEKFVCGVQNCGRTFPLKRYRDAHERSFKHQEPVSSTINYACDICSELFQKLEELKQHKLKHSSSKKFHCSYCKVHGYTRLSDLKRHLDVCPAKPTGSGEPQPGKVKNINPSKSSASGKMQQDLQNVKRKLFTKKSSTAKKQSQNLLDVANIFDSEPEDKDNGSIAREQPMRLCKNGVQEGFYRNGGSPKIKVEQQSSSSSSGGAALRSPKPSVKGKFKCDFCKQHFFERMKLIEHCDKMHYKKKDRNYPCKLCSAVYNSDEMFKFHMEQHRFDDNQEIAAEERKAGKRKKKRH